jgi:hypothetical protein
MDFAKFWAVLPDSHEAQILVFTGFLNPNMQRNM